MKKWNRFVLITVVLSILVSFAAMPAYAEDVPTSGKCGDNLTWSMDQSTDTLTISGTGKMYDYEFSEGKYAPWYQYNYNLATVIIEEGVTNIGAFAFTCCNSIMTLSLPDTLTELGEFSLSGCMLYDLELPNNLKKIGTRALSGNYFRTVTIPDSVTVIEAEAFEGCYFMEEIRLPRKLTKISKGTFSGCRKLMIIAISDSVTTVERNAFENCGNLEVVFYGGLNYQWQAITIEPGNDRLLNNIFLISNEYALPGAPNSPIVTADNVVATGMNRLRWEAVPGAVSYKVYRATTMYGPYSLRAETTRTEFISTTSKPGKQYIYKVSAVNADGLESNYSVPVRSVTRLARPEVTSGNAASTGYPKLTWNAVPGATAYKVYCADSRDSKYQLVNTTTALSFINTTVVPGQTYYYYVVAVMDGNRDADSAKSAIKSRVCDLPRPDVTLRSTTGKIIVSWDAVEGATGYSVYRAVGENGEYVRCRIVSSTSFTDTDLVAGQQYYYQVRAIMKGTPCAASAPSTPHYRTAR